MRKAPYPNRPKQDKELNHTKARRADKPYCTALREESQGEKQIMSEIEKIQRYIERSNIPRNRRYDASAKEIFAIASEMRGVDAVILAFDYGCAKGYRMAKAEEQARA